MNDLPPSSATFLRSSGGPWLLPRLFGRRTDFVRVAVRRLSDAPPELAVLAIEFVRTADGLSWGMVGATAVVEAIQAGDGACNEDDGELVAEPGGGCASSRRLSRPGRPPTRAFPHSKSGDSPARP